MKLAGSLEHPMGGMFSENAAIKKHYKSRVYKQCSGGACFLDDGSQGNAVNAEASGADRERSRLSLSPLPFSTVKTKNTIFVMSSGRNKQG
jgi:hypothetical protein